MCNKACIDFGQKNLKDEDVRGKSVIEVGSFDLNGSLRPIVEAFCPISYIGVDLQMGPGVDQICDAHDILDRFGYDAFDLLISTELLEHVKDWQKVISNFKHILKPNGVLLITTRSKGFYYHDYPTDFWRYEISDMQTILSDFTIEVNEKDPIEPGIFIKARKPNTFTENKITNYQLYSIIKDRHAKKITQVDIYFFKLRSAIRQFLSQILPIKKLQP